jgi:hypothetical protein
MSLILPPHMLVQHRPLRNQTTVALMQELHARDVLNELSGSLAMAADPFAHAAEYEEIRQVVLADLLRQMGVAIGSAGRAALFGERVADPSTQSGYREILHAKVLICKYPDPSEGQLMFNRQSPHLPDGLPPPPPTEPIPTSPTS